MAFARRSVSTARVIFNGTGYATGLPPSPRPFSSLRAKRSSSSRSHAYNFSRSAAGCASSCTIERAFSTRRNVFPLMAFWEAALGAEARLFRLRAAARFIASCRALVGEAIGFPVEWEDGVFEGPEVRHHGGHEDE